MDVVMFEGHVTKLSESFARYVGKTVYCQKKVYNLSALWLPSSGSTTENSLSAFETFQIKKIWPVYWTKYNTYVTIM